MGTITIKNLSVYTDKSAIARIAAHLNGDNDLALNDENGNRVINIRKTGSAFLVTDHEEATK